MKKSFSIQRYMRQADARFSGFDGYEDVDLNPGASVRQDFALANGGAPVKTPKPYVLRIVNSTASDLTAVLFGLNKYILTSNFGSDSGVTVTPRSNNVTYTEMLMQTGSQPYETSLIRLRSSNADQVIETLDITFKDASGQVLQDPIYSDTYVSAYQFSDNIADIPYSLTIDGNTNIELTILAD